MYTVRGYRCHPSDKLLFFSKRFCGFFGSFPLLQPHLSVQNVQHQFSLYSADHRRMVAFDEQILYNILQTILEF